MFAGRVRSMQPVDKRLLYGCDKRRSIYFNGGSISAGLPPKTILQHVLDTRGISHVLSQKNQSCRLAVIIVEHSAQTSPRSHSSSSRSNCFSRNDESVVQSLMVPLHMIMCNEMPNSVPERIFTKENHLLQTTFFDRPDKTFRIRIQIRRSRRQFDGLDAGIREDAQKLPRIQWISIVDEIALSRQEPIHGIR